MKLGNAAAFAGHFHNSMHRLVESYRRALIATLALSMIGVIALATATRMPCLRVGSGLWHVYKAGRMHDSEQRQSFVTQADEAVEDGAAEVKIAPLRYIPAAEALPLALCLTFPKHYFRSPPFLQPT